MAAVLGTLIGTQVYIQTQANQRESRQNKATVDTGAATHQFGGAPRAILALGTLNDPQALQFRASLGP